MPEKLDKEGMLSTSFTMESGPRALSPTYTDCDRVIQDIYAMTRRRPYLASTPRRQALIAPGGREGRTREGGGRQAEDLRPRANGPVRTLQCGLLGGPTGGPVLGGPPVLGSSRLPLVPRASLLPADVRVGAPSSRPLASMERRVGSPAVGTVRGQGTGLDLTRYGARGPQEPRASLDLSSRQQQGRGSSTVRAGGEGNRRPVLRRGHTDLQLRDRSTAGLEASFAGMGVKDESRENKRREESRISAIQARPLPPPVEPIYHSPLKPSKPPSPPSRRTPPSRPPQGPRTHYGRPQNSNQQDQGPRNHYGAPKGSNHGSQSEYAKPRIEDHDQGQRNPYGKGLWSRDEDKEERTSQPPTPREGPMPGLGPRASTALELVVGKSEGAVRRGLLWLQEDKLFSRWRERFVVLTTTHIVVHKKAASRISEMGAFLYKVGGCPACQHHSSKLMLPILSVVTDGI